MPGLENLIFEAGSPRVRAALGVKATAGPIRAPYPANDPRYAAFVGHMEQEFGNQFVQALRNAGYASDVAGVFAEATGSARVLMNNPYGPCNNCLLNLGAPNARVGVIQQLSRCVPNVTFTFEASGGTVRPIVVRGGQLVGS